MKQKKHYTARVEYRANKNEIDEFIKKGYSAIYIFEILKETKKLTMSYSAFCDYIRGNGIRQHVSQKKGNSSRPSGQLPAARSSVSRRQDIGTPGTPFIHNPRPDPAWFKEAKKTENETVGKN